MLAGGDVEAWDEAEAASKHRREVRRLVRVEVKARERNRDGDTTDRSPPRTAWRGHEVQVIHILIFYNSPLSHPSGYFVVANQCDQMAKD